jgi:hypothetical protein
VSRQKKLKPSIVDESVSRPRKVQEPLMSKSKPAAASSGPKVSLAFL